jgi:hypothetical protein
MLAGCLAVIVIEAYLSAAEYVGAECKFTEVYGVGTNHKLILHVCCWLPCSDRD